MRGFQNILVDFVADLRTGRPGEEPRLQVDQGSTGFFAGREFRTFRRINIGAGNSEVPPPLYTPQVTLAAGGTHTGGTVLDVLMARAAGATAQASSVGDALSDERGIAAGTYYFRISNEGSGTATGVFSARWEERPSGA